MAGKADGPTNMRKTTTIAARGKVASAIEIRAEPVPANDELIFAVS
jgi:hypothetical protein